MAPLLWGSTGFSFYPRCNLTRGHSQSQLKAKMGTSCVQAESFMELICPSEGGFGVFFGSGRPWTNRDSSRRDRPGMVAEHGIVPFRIVGTVVRATTLQSFACALENEASDKQKVRSFHLLERR